MLYKLVGGARVGKRWERALRQTGLSRWAARMGLTDSALNVEPACFCSLYEQTGLSIFLLKCSTPARADCAQLVLSTPPGWFIKSRRLSPKRPRPTAA